MHLLLLDLGTLKRELQPDGRASTVGVNLQVVLGQGPQVNQVRRTILPLSSYPFGVVGTLRCDVRAACSDATPSKAIVSRISVPPATTQAGTARRAIPAIALTAAALDRSRLKQSRKTRSIRRSSI